jgi:hypothetical protein
MAGLLCVVALAARPQGSAMSALRLPGPDGRIRLVPIDDGAVGRVYGQDRGGMIAIGGALVTAAPIPDYAAAYRAAHPERVRESQRRSRAK